MALLKGERQYLNPYEAAYDRYSISNGFFKDEDWSRIVGGSNSSDLDMYIGALAKTDKLDFAKVSNEYLNDYSDSETRLAMLYNEAYGRNDVYKEIEEKVYDSAGVGKTEKVTISEYEYNKRLIRERNEIYKNIHEQELKFEAIEQNKADMNWFERAEYTVEAGLQEFFLAIDGGLAAAAEFLLSFGDYSLDMLQSRNANEFYGYWDKILTNSGEAYQEGLISKMPVNFFKAMFTGEDFGPTLRENLTETERLYTNLRDARGNLTTFGKIVVGAASTAGEMVSSIISAGALSGAVGASGTLASIISKSTYYLPLASRSYYDTKKEFEALGISYNTNQLMANQLLKTSAEIAIEVALGKVLGVTGLDKALFGTASKTANVATKKGFGKIVAEVGLDALQEAGEEVLQEMSGVGIDNLFGEYVDSAYGDLSELTGEDLGLAAILGALISAGHGIANIGTGIISTPATEIKTADGKVIQKSKFANYIEGINLQSYADSMSKNLDAIYSELGKYYKPSEESIYQMERTLNGLKQEKILIDNKIAETPNNQDVAKELVAIILGERAKIGLKGETYSKYLSDNGVTAYRVNLDTEISTLEKSIAMRKRIAAYTSSIDNGDVTMDEKQRKSSAEKISKQITAMYANAKMLKAITNRISPEKLEAANKILTDISEHVKNGDFDAATVKLKIDEFMQTIQLEGVVVTKTLRQKIKDNKFFGVLSIFNKKENVHTDSSLSKEETKKIDDFTREIYKRYNESRSVIFAKNGKKPVEDENGNIVVPVNQIDRGIDDLFENLAEQRLVENLAKGNYQGNILERVTETYRKISGNSSASTELALYNLVFDQNFFVTMLTGDIVNDIPMADYTMYQFLSSLRTMEEAIVPKDTRDEVYKNKLKKIRSNWTKSLMSYLLLQPNAEYRLDYFTEAQKTRLKQMHESKEVANRFIQGVPTANDINFMNAKINAGQFTDEQKTKLKNDLRSDKPTVVKKALVTIDETYYNAFYSHFDGKRYMPTNSRKNQAFNKFLFDNGVDIEHLSNVTESTKNFIIDNYGDFTTVNLVSFLSTQLEARTNGRYSLEVIKKGSSNPTNGAFELDGLTISVMDNGNVTGYNELGDLGLRRIATESDKTYITTSERHTKLVNSILSKEAKESGAGYYTIDDVITDPSMLSPTLQKKIMDEYGELTSETAYSYFKHYFATEKWKLTLTVDQNGLVRFANVDNILGLFRSDSFSIKSGTKVSEVLKKSINPYVDNTVFEVSKRGKDVYFEARATVKGYQGVIVIGEKLLKSNSSKVAIAHEIQHAIQESNLLNLGNDSDLLGKLSDEDKTNVINSVKSKLPKLFENSSSTDEKIVNDFLYYGSGEIAAYGAEISDTVDFYPTVIKRNSDGTLNVTLPWGLSVTTVTKSNVSYSYDPVQAVYDESFELHHSLYFYCYPEDADTGMNEEPKITNPLTKDVVEIPEHEGKLFVTIDGNELSFSKDEASFDVLLDSIADIVRKIFSGDISFEMDAYKMHDKYPEFKELYRNISVDVRTFDGLSSALDDVFEFINEIVVRKEAESLGDTFFSQMTKAIESMKDGKQGAQSVIHYLKGHGVKDEEIKWSGIEEFLTGKKSVTKDELLEFANANMLQIEEIELKGNGTRWSRYAYQEGENYRELLFLLPDSNYSNNAMSVHWGSGQEGVIAHARVSDVNLDGEKILFIDEIQSDWHNEGQKHGFLTPEDEKTLNEADKKLREFRGKIVTWITDLSDYFKTNEPFAPDDLAPNIVHGLLSVNSTALESARHLAVYYDAPEKLIEEIESVRESYNEASLTAGRISVSGKVPEAPLLGTYEEFVMKRLMRIAVEKGYDKIAWTTSEMQMDRWNPDRRTNKEMGIPGSNNPDAIAFEEGYRIEYDQNLKSIMRKFGKKWGTDVRKQPLGKEKTTETFDDFVERVRNVRVGFEVYEIDRSRGTVTLINIDTGEAMRYRYTGETPEPEYAWSMSITDSMKESVIEQRFPLYNTSSSEQKLEVDEKFKSTLPNNATPEDVKKFFKMWNDDKDVDALFDKVYSIVEKIFVEGYAIKFSDADPEFVNRTDGKNVAGYYDGSNIVYYSDYMSSPDIDSQQKATTLLHEMIHMVVVEYSYALDEALKTGNYVDPLTGELIKLRKVSDISDLTLSKNVPESLKGIVALRQIYLQIQQTYHFAENESGIYGDTKFDEFIAELSNPNYRRLLKSRNLWTKIIDAIKRILNIRSKNMLDAATRALDKVLSDYNDYKPWPSRSQSMSYKVFSRQVNDSELPMNKPKKRVEPGTYSKKGQAHRKSKGQQHRKRISQRDVTKFGNLAKYKGEQLADDMYNFIALAGTGKYTNIDPDLLRRVKNGSLKRDTVMNYLYSASGDKDTDEATFSLINDTFFKNKYITSFKQLDDFIENKGAEYYAMNALLRRAGYIKELMSVDSLDFYDYYMSLVRDNPEYSKHFYNIVGRYTERELDTANLRRLWLQYFDGSVKSAGYIGVVATVTYTLSWKTVSSLSSTVGRSKDGKSTLKMEETVASNDEQDLSRYDVDTFNEFLSVQTRLDQLNAAIREYYVSLANDILSDPELSQAAKNKKFTEIGAEMISEQNEAEILYSNKLNKEFAKMYAKYVTDDFDGSLSLARQLISDAVVKKVEQQKQSISDDERLILEAKAKKALDPIVKKVVRPDGNLVRSITSANSTIKKYVTIKDKPKFLELYGDLFDENLDVKKELYSVEKDGKIRYLDRDVLINLKEQILQISKDTRTGYYKDRIAVKAREALRKSIQDVKNILNRAKADLEKSSKSSTKNIKNITVVTYNVSGTELLFNTHSGNEMPIALQQMVKTQLDSTAKSEVRYLSNDTDEHYVMNLTTFIEAHAEMLNNLTQQDVDEIVEFLRTSDIVTDVDVIKWSVVTMLIEGYLLKANQEGNVAFALRREDIDFLETNMRSRMSKAGTELSFWGQMLEEYDASRALNKALLKICDLELTVEEEKTLLNAIATNDISQIRVATNEVYKSLIPRYKTQKRTIWDRLWRWERMCMLSGPNTWLRNRMSNWMVTGANRLSEIITKTIPTTNAESKFKQYKIVGTKVTDEVRTFIDEYINKSGFLALVGDGFSKYDFNDTKKTATTVEKQLVRLITQNLANRLFDEHSSVNKFTQLTQKMITAAMSDQKSINRAMVRYLGKMLTEDKTDLSKGITKEVLQTITNAYTQAAFDYMHRPNFWSHLEQKARAYSYRKHGRNKTDFAFFMYKQIFPFASASWNWFVDKLQYNPVTLVKGIKDLIRLENTIAAMDNARSKGLQVESSRFAAYLARRKIGKGVIGTFALAIGVFLVAKGWAGKDEEDDKYKIKIGNYLIDISDVYGSSGLLAGITLAQTYVEHGEFNLQTFGDMFINSLATMFDDSTFSDLHSSFRRTATFSDFLVDSLEDVPGMLIPNFVKTLSSLSLTRKPKYSGGIKGYLEKFAVNSFAPFGYLLPHYVNPYTGEPELTNYGIWWLPAVNKFSTVKMKPFAVTDIERISYELGVYKASLTGDYTIKDVDVKLTPAENQKLNEFYGKLNERTLSEFMNNKTSYVVEDSDGKRVELKFSRMTQTQKAAVIKRIMSNNSGLSKIYILTDTGKYKYYASDSEYSELLELGIAKNVYRKTGKYEGFVEIK